MKILVADDDEVVRTFVHRVVEQASHEVLLAEDGKKALTLVQSEDPDLLITDLRMPELDGFGLIEAVRSAPGREGLPIICLSSVNQREEVAKLITRGISDYVLKPVRPGELADRIRTVSLRERNWKLARSERATAR
jgi:DNA-binding response OmpR family regulator